MTSGTEYKARDFRQEVTDKIIELLEKGAAPWQKPWSASSPELPINPTTGKPYRGGNAVHLLAVGMTKGYEDPRWLTYKQSAENGWQVRKGERGTQIEFWDLSKENRTTAEGKETDDSRDRTSADAAEPWRPIHRVYTVFNAQQIEGMPAHIRRERPSFEVVQSAESILNNSGVRIFHDQQDRAFYSRRTDTIHLPRREAFDDAAKFYGVALHETAHATGHPSRLNRPTLNESYRFGDMNYAKEELRAELASVFLAAERGIPHDPEQHAAYLSSWIAVLREDKHEIFRAARDAHLAADYLLGLEQERSPEVESPADAGRAVSPAGRGAGSFKDSLRNANSMVKEQLGETARLYPARTDSGIYRGEILGETDMHVVQRLSASSAVAHPKSAMPERLTTGAALIVAYGSDCVQVSAMPERSKSKGLGRA